MSRSWMVVLLGLAAVALLLGIIRPVQAQVGRPQWEYTCVVNPDSRISKLLAQQATTRYNALGADGWEAVTTPYMGGITCFKRRK